MALRLLLDTHTLIWWWNDDPKLPAKMCEMLSDRRNEIIVSVVSAWEIATKVRRGQLPEMNDHIGDYDRLVTEDGFAHLMVTHDHAVKAGLLKGKHRDPFDRMLAAQGQAERLTIVTRDPAFGNFGCEVLW